MNAEDKRRVRYEKVKQTGSVQGYISAFKDRLMYLNPQPSPYEVLRQFKKGLNEKIKFEMATRHPDVIDVGHYFHLADSIDRAFKEAGSDSSRTSTRTDSSSNHPLQSGPVRVNYVGPGMPSQRRDPKAFKEWCRTNRACFMCGSKEHNARACPKNSGSNGSGNSSRPQ